MTPPLTLFDKIWAQHEILKAENGLSLMWVDRHYIHEGSFQGFDKVEARNAKVARPDLTFGIADHYVPTNRNRIFNDPSLKHMVEQLVGNTAKHGITLMGMDDPRQGIVHVVGPEQGLTMPGLLIVCGDSHTATHGALGAIAIGIGASEVSHVMLTQTFWQKKPKRMRVTVDGKCGPGIGAKDIALSIIAKIGTNGAQGHAVEYAGRAIRALTQEGRLTLCNLAIEAGARTGMVAPDDTTFAYVKGKPFAPKGADFDRAVAVWQQLPSDSDADFDTEVSLDASAIAPVVTWGTSPEDTLPIDAAVPDPAQVDDPDKAKQMQGALDYMGLTARQKLTDIRVDRVFIGSCTNARIEDLRAAAAVLSGRKAKVPGLVSAGSTVVKHQAEQEGLDKIFTDAGLTWGESGCSMCLGINGDIVPPGERCASTTNRNFRGRQGPGARTHLMSPAMVAAAAVNGHLADVRPLLSGEGVMEAFKMQPFGKLDGVAVALRRDNVDTDQVIPARFLKVARADGLGDTLFRDLRFDQNGRMRPDFPLNDPARKGASVLVGRHNFGVGSSREAAVYALVDYGIRCVVATSFGDIFAGNAVNNGLVAAIVTPEDVEKLLSAVEQTGKAEVDLEAQTIKSGNYVVPFSIDPARRTRLLNGWDDLDLTQQYKSQIDAFAAKDRAERPWAVPGV